MHENDELGQCIKLARIAHGYSRDEFSEKIGIASRYLINIENKNQKPSYKVLVRIVRELDLSVDNIIYPERQTDLSRKATVVEKLNRCNEDSLDVIDGVLDILLKKQNK